MQPTLKPEMIRSGLRVVKQKANDSRVKNMKLKRGILQSLSRVKGSDTRCPETWKIVVSEDGLYI